MPTVSMLNPDQVMILQTGLSMGIQGLICFLSYIIFCYYDYVNGPNESVLFVMILFKLLLI